MLHFVNRCFSFFSSSVHLSFVRWFCLGLFALLPMLGQANISLVQENNSLVQENNSLVQENNSAANVFASNQQPLPVEQAFAFDYDEQGSKLHLIWQIADRYYLYQDKMRVLIDGQIQTLTLPEGQGKNDPLFGDTKVYTQQVSFWVDTSAFQGTNKTAMNVEVGYQGCWEGGVCYPPKTTALTLTNISASSSSSHSLNDFSKTSSNASFNAPLTNTMAQITNVGWFETALSQASLVWLVVIFFVSGVALSLTPCMLPMVPILSNIIVGMNPRPDAFKSFLLSLSYVLAMAATYSVAGIVSGLSGANMQVVLQHPWVISAMVILFLVLAAAMFGWVKVQVPKVIQNQLNNLYQQQSQGQFLGVMMMGVLSALIMGPCVAAPLAGALLYIGQTGDPYTGGLALFSLGIGMGLPLLVVGTSAGKYLPKTGVWMPRVNYIFGFLMLFMAVWQLDKIAATLTVPLVALITIIMAMLLWQVSRWQPSVKTLMGTSVAYLLALILSLYSISLMFSWAVGQPSIFNPLATLSASQYGPTSSAAPTITPEKITSSLLAEKLAEASQAQRPVLVDFYADWCITCKELEVFVFPHEKVQSALAGWVFLQVDITDNNDADKRLLKQYQLVGPPALVFVDRYGLRLDTQTMVGVPGPQHLAARLQTIAGP